MRSILQRGAMGAAFALSLGMLAAPFVARSDESAQVKIDNFTFGPGKISIAKGSAVTWTNEDDIPHTVVLTALGVRSKTLDTEKAFTYQFDKAGTFAYICGLHPNMHGQVVVR